MIYYFFLRVRMKKQIISIVILCGYIFSIQGMLQRARLLRSPNNFKSRNFSRSLPLRKPVNKDIPPITISNPEIQKTSNIAQSGGWWNWLSSFVQKSYTPEQMELKTKGIDGIMYELLYPQNKEQIKDNAGIIRNIRSFDDNDLNKAKQKISQLVNLDANYKNSVVTVKNNPEPFWIKDLRTEESHFGTIMRSFYLHNLGKWGYEFTGTILDEVLYKIFSGEHRVFDFSTPVNKQLNYIRLAQWLVDNGFKSSPNNQKWYNLGYEEVMKAYKNTYKPESFSRKSLVFLDENSFKKIFAELDPLLEKIIINPELKKILRSFQQERREIEKNPQKFREELIEEEKRSEYIHQKGQKIQSEYINRTGDWTQDTSTFYKQAEENFNKAEYEEWKQTGSLGDDQYVIPMTVIEKKIQALEKKFKLPSNASTKMILQSIQSYIKMNHSDTLKSNQDMSAEEKDKKAQEYAEFIGSYDDVIQELKKREKQERENEVGKA